MKYLYIILCILSLKFIINLIYLIECKYYLNKYMDWLYKGTWKLIESRQKVISLMKNANVRDSYVSNVEPAGYGMLSTGHVSVLNNFPNNREDLAKLTLSKFHEAIGVYKGRILETISPIYWIRTIIYLPKSIFSYLGVDGESVVIKIFQILWWLSGIIYTVLRVTYQSEITVFIKQLVNKI